MTDESFAAVVDLAPVNERRLRRPKTERTCGRSSEADVREYVGVVAFLNWRMSLVYTDEARRRGGGDWEWIRCSRWRGKRHTRGRPSGESYLGGDSYLKADSYLE